MVAALNRPPGISRDVIPIAISMNIRKNEAAQEGRRANPNKYLIVGLGNPGRAYQGNRHNIGFMVVDRLAQAHGVRLNRAQHRALLGDGQLAGHTIYLAKPQTYMNLSGDSVGPLARYYRIPPERILVIYDDIDLPLGTLRLRESGGAGGHNGMKSIIDHLGEGFPRLRLGIDRPAGEMPPSAYVLRDFSTEDHPLLEEVIENALIAVEDFVRDGADVAMSRHNRNLKEAD
jgi:PTH1 family peptidyl-tRNA hydrolase